MYNNTEWIRQREKNKHCKESQRNLQRGDVWGYYLKESLGEREGGAS